MSAKRRQAMRLIALVPLFSLAFATAANATPGERFYIQEEGASVHEAPNAAAPVVRLLERGDRVIEFRREGSWVKVGIFGTVGKDGWVQSAHLGPEPPEEPTAAVETPHEYRLEAVLLADAPVFLPQARARERCPGAPQERYRINVQTEIPPPKVNRSLGRGELGLMPGHFGLTATALKIEYAANYAAEPYGDGHCFWVKQVDVLLRYETPDVYVAKEYETGSCNYEVILEHETEHVKVAQDHLKRYASRIGSALTSLLIPKRKSAIVVDSPEEAKRKVNEVLQRVIYPGYLELERGMDEAHEKLDTPDERRKMVLRCSRELHAPLWWGPDFNQRRFLPTPRPLPTPPPRPLPTPPPGAWVTP
jgi:hypothetical protein